MAAPCVGCGYCCTKALCFRGLLEHGDMPGPCPSLVFKAGRYWCGIVLAAREPERSKIIEGLAVGAGCSSSLLNTRRESFVRRGKE
jgi:hypothetical protein